MSLATINWGSVADWVSGIGSLSAGLVALYLARSNSKIRLSGYCGIRTSVGGVLPVHDMVFIKVTNIGTRSTVITTISMRVGVFKRRQAIITFARDASSVGLPVPVTDGQDAHWGIPLDEQRTWIQDLCKTFVHTKADITTLRFCIHTSHGDTLKLRPEKGLRDALHKALRTKAA